MDRRTAISHSYRDHLASLYEKEKELIDIHQNKDTNAGLWLDKYLTDQDRTDLKDRESAKGSNRAALVDAVAKIPTHEAYRQFYQRWKLLLDNAGAKIREAKVKGRMIVGLGDESVLEISIALHHTYGIPYIPGSALKGLAASYTRQRLTEEWQPDSPTGAYKTIFGDTNGSGGIIFFDALYIPDTGPGQNKQALYPDIITVHHPEYYQGGKEDATPSDWDSPTPIHFLSATGVYLVALAAPDLKYGQTWINKTFAILRLALQELGIGAKTSSGYGRMELEKKEEDDIIETEAVEEVVLEPASTSLLRKIAAAPQVTYELFAAWEQLPLDDERRIEVAEALVQKWDSGGGKKRNEKQEKRYQMLNKFILL
jgi:CRISPR-associated protein Cmr6